MNPKLRKEHGRWRPCSRAVVVLTMLAAGSRYVQAEDRDYHFDGRISQAVLENYLSRAITMDGVCAASPAAPYATPFKEDLRMIRNTAAKFIIYAAYTWDAAEDDEAHFALARKRAEQIHAVDPEIILQAAVFETAYSSKSPETARRVEAGFSGTGVEDIPVPDWVFKEFGVEPQPRTFDYEAMLYQSGRGRNHWMPGASIPDMSRPETKMWFFYRAKRYIDAGYESIHFGQPMIMDENDPDHRHWREIVGRIRNYGRKHARRRYVLCDGHVGAGVRFGMRFGDGEQFLWDFYAMVLRPKRTEEPLEAVLELGHLDSLYGRVPGGIHPCGWRCEHIPHYSEFDNCVAGLTTDPKYAAIMTWGADESTWFANQPEVYRNRWLHYAWQWLWRHDAAGYLAMPGRRPAWVPVLKPRLRGYMANMSSAACPNGFSQEETIKAIWSDPRFQDNSAREISEPKPAAKHAQQDIPGPLIGYWSCDQIDGSAGRYVLRDASGAEFHGRLIDELTPELLEALYLVHGAMNDKPARQRGQKMLREICETPRVDLVPGRKDRALRFTGQAYVELPGDPRLSPPVFTLALWLKTESLEQTFLPIQKFQWMKTGFYLKHHRVDGKFYAEVFDGSGRRHYAATSLSPKRWTHLALTADGRNLTLYINGQEAGTSPTGPIVANDRPLWIGKACSGVSVDEIRLYNRALSRAELRELMEEVE